MMGTFAAVAVVWYLLGGNEIFSIVKSANPALIAISFALSASVIPISAVRWLFILRTFGASPRLAELVRIQFVSHFIGAGLVFSGASDVVRAAMLKSTGARLALSAASVLVDRLYGLMGLAILALLGSLIALTRGDAQRVFGASAILCLIILAGIPALLVLAKVAGRNFQVGVRSRTLKAFLTFSSQIEPALLRPHALLIGLAISIAGQSVGLLAAITAASAVHAAVAPSMFLVFMPVVWLATQIPITIVGLGVREASFAALFSAVGAAYADGAAVGAVLSAVNLGIALMCGFALLKRGASH